MKIPVPIDLILVIIAIIICHFAKLEQLFDVKVLKDIPLGIPVPVIPSPVLMYRYLFEGFLLAIVSYMMVAMMATLFAQRHQYRVDNNQELAANGLACIVGSFLSSLAPSTSPPRCFLMESTGGRTQVSYLVSACLVFITVMAIAPLFYSLPKCVLASIVIVACIPLFVHYTMWLTYWRTDRYDFSIWVVTFTMTFIAGVDYGLIIGVGFSLAVVHFRMQHSQSVSLLPSSDGSFVLLNSKCYSGVSPLKNVVIFQFNGPVYFATSSVFKRKLQTAVDSLSKEERQPLRNSVNEQNVEYHSVASLQSKIETEECNLKDDVNCGNNANLRLKLDDNHVDGDVEALKPFQNLETDNNVDGDVEALNPSQDLKTVKVIIINCCGISFMDTGGATAIAQVHQAYSKQSIKLVLACCTEDVLAQLNKVAQCRPLLSDSVFPSVQDALISCNWNIL